MRKHPPGSRLDHTFAAGGRGFRASLRRSFAYVALPSLSLSVCVCVSVHRSAGWEPPPCSRVWLAAVAGREENLWRGGDEKEVTGTVFFTWGGQQCSRSLSVSQSHITLPSQAQSDPVYVAQGSRGSLGKIPRVQVALWFWLLYCRSMCRSSEVVQTVLRPRECGFS